MKKETGIDDRYKRYTVEIKDGISFLYFDGERLPLQTDMIIKQGMDEIAGGFVRAEVTITVLAILKDTQ